MSDNKPTGGKASLLSNILAIIGLIILVVIIVWGLVHVAELSSGWVSSLFAPSGPTIKVTAPADATSGAPVTVSWDYSTTATGSYAFLYQCQTGFQYAAINTTTNTASGIPCGAAFSVTPSNNSIQILPLLSGTTSTSVPFSILFIPTSGSQVQGDATMTVHPGSPVASAPTTTTTQPTQTAPAKVTTPKPATVASYSSTYTYRTPADLAVHIISLGVDQYDNAVITFSVSNVGGTRSSTYSFTAQLPTLVPTPYASSIQAPLVPGGYIVNTIRFPRAVNGVFSVALSAGDNNRSNNFDSRTLITPMNYYGNSNGYNYNYNYNGNGYNYNYNSYSNYNQYPTYQY